MKKPIDPNALRWETVHSCCRSIGVHQSYGRRHEKSIGTIFRYRDWLTRQSYWVAWDHTVKPSVSKKFYTSLKDAKRWVEGLPTPAERGEGG